LSLTACSYKDKLEAVLNSYKGYNVEEISERLGFPKEVIEDGNSKIYKYGFTFSNYIPPASTGYGFGFNNYGNVNYGSSFYRGYYATNSCLLEFKVDRNNIVQDWDWSGNSCKSFAKKKYVNPQYILDLPKMVSRVYGFEYKKVKNGIQVTSVDTRSHAALIGLRVDDIIQKINGTSIVGLPVEFADDYISRNKKIKLEILRNNLPMELDVRLTELPTLELYKESVRKFLGYGAE